MFSKSFVLCFLFTISAVMSESKKSWRSTINKHPVYGPKFVDIYTNHDNFEEVLKQYSEIRNKNNPNPIKRIDRKNDKIQSEFGEIVDLTPSDLIGFKRRPYFDQSQDITNFNIENLESTFENDKMIPLKLYSTSNRRPKFKTQKYNWNFTEFNDNINNDNRNIDKNNSPKRFSYIENLHSSNNINNNKHYVLVKNDTKHEVNNMLNKYINKLYIQKYNTDLNRNIHKIPKNDLTPSNSKIFGEAITAVKNKTIKIANKFFSLLQVVQFSNSKCTVTSSSGDYDGICYYSTECTRLNGTAMGNCASGYGVCCVFRNTCGGTSSQNCTYFESPNYPNYYPANDTGTVVPTTQAPTTTTLNPTPDPRWKNYYYNEKSNYEFWPEARQETSNTLSCILRINKLNSNVTQMRIDFIDFELMGPTNGNCVLERLVISGQNVNSQIPNLCGYNTGQHIYVDVSMLSGPLSLSVLSTVVARKRFKIRICQYANTCTQSNCLQYYTGTSGVITSFNYDQAMMFNRSTTQYLNNLNYGICIRKEAGYCSITYTNVRNGVEYPFQLNNVNSTGMRTVPQGQAGADVINCPNDYIILDGSRLCGDKLNDGLTNSNFSVNAPITDTNAGPIVIPVRTNGNVTGLGFKIFYTLNRCPTT